jgi:hypothetical protein
MADSRHTAVIREAQLAAGQICHGVTALGNANHAQTALYAQAFFGLSIGLERMGKLIFIADYAIKNDGRFPTDEKELRRFGHDLSVLLPNCEAIAKTLNPSRSYADRPISPINEAVAEVLTLFATKLRYYNLGHLAGTVGDQRDPIALWWEKVGIPICQKHYTQRQRQKDEDWGDFLDQALGGSSVVVHTAEEGTSINSLSAMHRRAGATRVVQMYGRMYALQIVRWMGSTIFELSHTGAYEKRIEALLGMHEPFSIFHNEDHDLRRCKKWSI